MHYVIDWEKVYSILNFMFSNFDNVILARVRSSSTPRPLYIYRDSKWINGPLLDYYRYSLTKSLKLDVIIGCLGHDGARVKECLSYDVSMEVESNYIIPRKIWGDVMNIEVEPRKSIKIIGDV